MDDHRARGGPTRRGHDVRERTEDDLPVLFEALRAVHAVDGYPVEGPRSDWLTPDGLLKAWVAVRDGLVAGHVAVAAPQPDDAAAGIWGAGRPSSPVVVMNRLFVSTPHRGLGIGGTLTRTAMAFAGERDTRLVLDVLEKDRAARRLYERLGWKPIGTAAHRYPGGNPVPAICFVAPPAAE